MRLSHLGCRLVCDVTSAAHLKTKDHILGKQLVFTPLVNNGSKNLNSHFIKFIRETNSFIIMGHVLVPYGMISDGVVNIYPLGI